MLVPRKLSSTCCQVLSHHIINGTGTQHDQLSEGIPILHYIEKHPAISIK